ncbi:MAG: branched-chain amino acid ABC transporter permease [Dermatophilaceae bacterium]
MSTASEAASAVVPVAPAPGRSRRLGDRRAVGAATVAAAGLLPLVADAYTVTIAATALVFAVLTMSTQLLVGVAGLPAFGQAAYLGVGAYTAALLAQAGTTAGPVQLAAAAAAGALVAAATAPLVLRTRATAFLMTTFAVQSLVATVAAQWQPVTGGDDGLHTPAVTPWPGLSALTGAASVYWYTLICFVVLAAVVAVLVRSRLGLVLRGCADHESRMAALGYPVTRHLAIGYTAAGGLAGAGGALLIAVNRYVSPADLGFEVAALALLAAAIGAGSLAGSMVGAVVVIAVRDLVGPFSGGHSHALLGVLFLTVAYGRPLAQAALARRREQTTRSP